jgi:hypothetical protein
MTDKHDDYIELFLKWSGSGESQQAKTWLQTHGLSLKPMKQGLLITGSRQQIEQAFSVSLDNRTLPVEVPVPVELEPFVASITLPQPRSYYR